MKRDLYAKIKSAMYGGGGIGQSLIRDDSIAFISAAQTSPLTQ
jgi:hypothetical protein